MILLPPDGPLPHPQSPAYPQPIPGPSIQSPTSSQTAVISPEDDVQRLFNVCKVGRGNAELLQEVLVYARPQELKNEITKELLGRARASHELIGSQITWATTEAEKSRRASHAATETIHEQLLAALLAAHEQLTECLKMYEDLERIAIEQQAEERMKTERLIQALTAVSEYRPSPEEGSLIDRVFTVGDPEHTGKINPQTATRIFSAANLPPDALARIWEIASVDSKDGLLDRQGVGVALRLIGHAQGGAVVAEALVKRPGPLAVLENMSPIASESAAGPSTGVAFATLPPFTSHDKSKFRKIFKASGAQNGILGGPQAKEVFLKSRLPNEKLNQIWELADMRRRGFLDVADFSVAMYLIQALMTGKIHTLPNALPPNLYEEAAQHTPNPSPSPQPNNNLPPPPPVHPSRAPSTSALPPLLPPPPRHPSSRQSPSHPPGSTWDISPAAKVQADHIFSTLDPRNKGRAKGEAVRSYLHQAGLSPHAAGRIWDLTDIGRKGCLTREEFAVAMHLLKMRKDGHHLPNTLPPGVLSTQAADDEHDAYTGLAADSRNSLYPNGGAPQMSTSHLSHRSEDDSPRLRSGPSHLRASRSTSNIPTLVSPLPISPISTSSPTPFPMSPLPTTTSYFPTQATDISQWNIKAEDRARYDRYFDQLDTLRKGYLLSDVAVPFFARANLPQDVMATIWDMADSEHDGQLTRSDFAIAMHLIRQKLAGRELPAQPSSVLSSQPASPHSDRSPQPQSVRNSRETPLHRSSTSSHIEPVIDPATIRLPEGLDDDIRSETPPPPYELIAPEST